MENTRMLKRNPQAAPTEMKVGTKSPKTVDSLMSDLLESVTVVHKAHLKITGEGSYAAHKAMGEFYDGIGDLADSLIEGYQGLTESLLDLGPGESPSFKTAKECVSYLNSIYKKVDAVQAVCTYSEINNDLDNVKSLINSTKYKLIFLK
jgi:DNA-binding ferritin-like protein